MSATTERRMRPATEAPVPEQPSADTANVQGQVQPVAKRKRSRSPSVAKPAFIVLQVIGDDGQPVDFDKKKLKVLAVERDPGKVLESIDAGEYSNAFYLRVVVPAGSRAGSPNKPKE